MELIVSSNCQTAGIAAALREIFPNDEIVAMPLPAAEEQAEQALAAKLYCADVWVSAGKWHFAGGHAQFLKKYAVLQKNPALRLICIPALGFNAFHPDLCYARRRSDDSFTSYHYNSAIAVWCYQHGISVEAAARLFNESSFRGLGYFDAWGPAAAHLQALFKGGDLKDDADRFLLRIKRNGVFMHSTNHPRADTLVLLAKFVAMHLGEDGSVLDREILIDDGLSFDVWPVYPEIADHLGVAGSGYRWRIGGHTRITGLAAYLSYAYDSYAAQGIAPEDIVVFHYDDSKLDAVLAPQAGL